jgi:hypothetical protein
MAKIERIEYPFKGLVGIGLHPNGKERLFCPYIPVQKTNQDETSLDISCENDIMEEKEQANEHQHKEDQSEKLRRMQKEELS